MCEWSVFSSAHQAAVEMSLETQCHASSSNKFQTDQIVDLANDDSKYVQ